MLQDRRDIWHLAVSDGVHGAEGQRDGAGHRQVEPHQPLEAFRPPAMRGRRDRRDGRDQRHIGIWRLGGDLRLDFLHCSTFLVTGRIRLNGLV